MIRQVVQKRIYVIMIRSNMVPVQCFAFVPKAGIVSFRLYALFTVICLHIGMCISLCSQQSTWSTICCKLRWGNATAWTRVSAMYTYRYIPTYSANYYTQTHAPFHTLWNICENKCIYLFISIYLCIFMNVIFLENKCYFLPMILGQKWFL